jgi:hypothetical protein
MKPFSNSVKLVKDKYIVEVWCPECDCSEKFEMTRKQYKEWYYRTKPIQDIFPNIKYDKREMLISGICPSCWDKLFGKGEE